MERRFLVFALCVCPILFSSALSQNNPRTVRVTITSNLPNSRVLIDSVDVGMVPLENYGLTEGRHTVCVVSGNDRHWITNAECRTIEAKEGLQVHMRFPRSIRVTSEPYGSSVVYRDTIQGETPSLLWIPEDVGTVRLTKEGYEEVALIFDGSTSALHGVLKPKETVIDGTAFLYLEKEESQTALPVVISVSSAVLSGALAAHWKLRADNLYRDYQRTGDPANLNQIHQLDVASGIALGVSQLSLAFLTYVLISR
jgi:hypothetical protein